MSGRIEKFMVGDLVKTSARCLVSGYFTTYINNHFGIIVDSDTVFEVCGFKYGLLVIKIPGSKLLSCICSDTRFYLYTSWAIDYQGDDDNECI